MSIAKKHAQQYMPNGEVSLEQVIQAAIDEATDNATLRLVAVNREVVELKEHIRQLDFVIEQHKNHAIGLHERIRQLSEAYMAAGRASIIAYKEGKNGIERHPGNTAHENAAWEWGRKDGGWENKK